MAKATTTKPVSFTERLAKMEKTWSQTSEAAGGGGGGVNANVESGKQEMRLVEAKLVEVSNGTKIMISWTWDCVGAGTAEQRKKDPQFGYVTSRDGLDTDQNMGHMKRKLRFFGFNSADVKAAELEDALGMITKGHPLCNGRVWLSQDEQWQNVQLLGDGPIGWETDPWAEEAPAEEGGVSHLPELDAMDRLALRKYIAAGKLAVKVMTNMDDDAIRAAIREVVPVEEAVAEEEPAAEEEVPLEEEAAAIEKGSVVLYTPPRAKSALTCEVLDAPDAKGTVKLKNQESGKALVGRVALDQLELAATEEAPVEEEPVVEEEAPVEEEFATIKKGSKVECRIKDKAYQGVVNAEPTADAEEVSVKFNDGPYKGKVLKIKVENIEPVE